MKPEERKTPGRKKGSTRKKILTALLVLKISPAMLKLIQERAAAAEKTTAQFIRDSLTWYLNNSK